MNEEHLVQPGDLILRKATITDLDIIVHHRRSMFTDMGHQDQAAMSAMLLASRAFFAERLENGRFQGWLIESALKEVVAGGGLVVTDYLPSPTDPFPKRAVIVNMYTEHAYRREGLARKLMLTMIAWCRNEGFGSVLLHASPDGRPLYEQLGFKATNEMRLMLR